MKYFTSTTILSGLQPPPSLLEVQRPWGGSISVGLEAGWLPNLDPEQTRVGFSGRKEEDLNKTHILLRPVVRVGLPWRFTAVAAGPLPIETFGVTPRLLAFGLERPIWARSWGLLSWRGTGQVGSIRAAITCPQSAIGAPAGSPSNPSGCVGLSNDKATLRYAGTELQLAVPIPNIRRMTVHGSAGVNVIDSAFQVDAPLETRQDRNRLWTRGATFSSTFGASYRLTDRVSLNVDAFYSPLSVRRNASMPSTNDGLFNVRTLLAYELR